MKAVTLNKDCNMFRQYSNILIKYNYFRNKLLKIKVYYYPLLLFKQGTHPVHLTDCTPTSIKTHVMIEQWTKFQTDD